MRQKCVKHASKMRHNVSCFIGKRGTFPNATKRVIKNRQKCAEHPCPSIPWFFCFTKEKPQIYQGFSPTAEPTNPWRRQRKYQNNQGNSLLKINQGNPRNQGKEGQGPFGENTFWMILNFLFASVVGVGHICTVAPGRKNGQSLHQTPCSATDVPCKQS